MDSHCVAAISTPPGEGGIAIVRVSGSNAIDIVDRIFTSRSGEKLPDRPSHTLTLGWIKDQQGCSVDEALVSIMRGPRSYTGEDVVEINCHGGALAARKCLELVLSAGGSLAEPGEFTRRAFLNGRLDVAQAESVIEIIRARSERALSLSVKNLQGALSQAAEEIETRLATVNAQLEASIDFPEEVGDPDWPEVTGALEQALGKTDRMINGGRRLKVYREGVNLVIAGKPNVGKSSLLNALVGKNRAIVTDIPGTTRDVIEDYINIAGIPARIFDTAGIRETRDFIESMGVEKTREAVQEADLVLFMLDAGTGLTPEDKEIMELMKNQKAIVLVNKTDLDEKRIDEAGIRELMAGARIIKIAAKHEVGLEELEKAIEEEILAGHTVETGEEIMVNVRQEQLLQQARDHIQDTLAGIKAGVAIDALAVDTWGAVSCLEELTGKQIKTAIIDKIFADFCIGK